MNKILISSCLLGENVRYNGQIKKLMHPLLTQWQAENRLVTVCPEVCGGLSIPRAPAEIEQSSNRVLTAAGDDVTYAFNIGAKNALRLCEKHHIRFAILKESSPSCGSQKIYDGSFSQTKINGAGVTAKLLIANDIAVYSEENIETLAQLIEKAEA